ncbi:MAG: hypothetical protein ABI333_16380 [bacterium]
MQRIFRYTAALLSTLGVVALAGCPKPGASTARPRAHATQRLTMEPIMIVAERSGVGYRSEAFSADELFGKALAAQRKGRCAEATATYRKLLKYFGRSPYGPPSHYNAALCFQVLKRWRDAARHFETASRGVKKSEEVVQALGAAGVNYAEAGSWSDSQRCFEALLGRTDLSTHQRIEALARHGLAWLKSQNFSKASKSFDAALALYRKTRTAERLPTTFYVAMAVYHKAMIYHELFKATPLRLPEEQMSQDVEAMATWMYKAQRGYWDVVQYKNHFWAMAAVYQVGTLYWEFRKALIAAPVPHFVHVRYFDKVLKRYETINAAEQRAAYFQKLRAKTRILLRHAITVYQKAIVTAERIGAKNKWVKRLHSALATVKRRYAKEPTEGDEPATGAPVRPKRSPLVPRSLDPAKYRPAAVEL